MSEHNKDNKPTTPEVEVRLASIRDALNAAKTGAKSTGGARHGWRPVGYQIEDAVEKSLAFAVAELEPETTR